jgi:hypothetical protein
MAQTTQPSGLGYLASYVFSPPWCRWRLVWEWKNGFEIRYVTFLCDDMRDLFHLEPLWRVVASIHGSGIHCNNCSVLVPNTWWGWRYADDLRCISKLSADMMPVTSYQLVRLRRNLPHPPSDRVDYLPFLRQVSVRAFRHLCDDPPFRQVSCR